MAIETPELLVALTTSIIAAAIGGAVAVRLRQSAVVGYIVAGVAIGPRTPGFVADIEVVNALADLGVIFLMFSIGVQISIHEIRRVGRLVAIGGTAQVAASVAIGWAIGMLLGWSSLEALFLGAFTSISSTAIAGRILSERGETESEHGVITIGWLAVQDLLTIVLIVLLSALSGSGSLEDVAVAVAKAIAFMVIVIPIGIRLLPRLFEFIAASRRRELFTLGVVAVTLGTAALGEFFGVSLALAAFVAGMLIADSDLSHQVMGEAAPFRDVFAGLFFVSIGMLVDPAAIVGSLPLLVVLLVLIGPVKAGLVTVLGALFRYPIRTAAFAGLLLGQSAEFSFLLARIGEEAGVIGEDHFGLLLSSAALTIVFAPAAYLRGRRAVDRLQNRLNEGDVEEAVPADPGDRRRIAVICGYGRVGRLVAAALQRRGFGFVIVDESRQAVREARDAGMIAIRGSVENRVVLDRAPIERATVLVVAIPDPVTTRFVVDTVRRQHPRLPIVARTHSQTERATLRQLGATVVVVGEVELALEMTRFTLRQFGVSGPELVALIEGLRRR